MTSGSAAAALARIERMECSRRVGRSRVARRIDSGTLASLAVGSNAQGAQAGDRVPAAVTNETLCFKVTLPLSTGNAFQDLSTTVTFTFDAEQTANKP